MIADLSQSFVQSVSKLGAAARFLWHIVSVTPGSLRRGALITHQIYNAGVLSLVIIMTSGFFVGMVIGLQAYDSLARLRQEDLLGAGAALTLIKELGPVVTVLLFAGRAGTAIASEIGLMRATDQLSAIEMMAVDPLEYIVAPRFLGAVVAVPLLTAIFDAVGILGAYVIGVELMGVDAGGFWTQMQEYVDPEDIAEGVVKSVVFGVTVGLVAVFEGYHATSTAEGVGMATTRTVVTTAVAVLFLDYIITALLL